ncbi:hypothetical protein E4K21_001461 [Enterococcus faecalis]|nr:hypothetical protein [Enterococcus faecalis]EGO8266430.1 hypothetical protein [Enterococcus faecalis]EGO8315327.1 hypothetical protein [Enterococcus faecalis]EGO9490645.1 hypothetical protein [Enterococcus faecalis]EGQ7431901.1 hypothetical protein [Enterococcus faecalis]
MTTTDIVQLKEKGKPVYLKTHAAAIDGIENGLFVRKNIEITDLNNAKEPGIYSIPATGVENKPLPNSGSLIVNKDPGGVRQLFQTERTLFIRQFGGNPSNWTSWKEVSFKAQKTPLWTGAWYGGASGNGNVPSKPLSQCENGWIFQWQEYKKDGTLNGACYHFFLVPKQHVQNPGSGGVVFLLHGYNANSLVRKYLYVKDTKITGNDINASSSDTAGSGSKMFALSAIYEY